MHRVDGASGDDGRTGARRTSGSTATAPQKRRSTVSTAPTLHRVVPMPCRVEPLQQPAALLVTMPPLALRQRSWRCSTPPLPLPSAIDRVHVVTAEQLATADAAAPPSHRSCQRTCSAHADTQGGSQ